MECLQCLQRLFNDCFRRARASSMPFLEGHSQATTDSFNSPEDEYRFFDNRPENNPIHAPQPTRRFTLE